MTASSLGHAPGSAKSGDALHRLTLLSTRSSVFNRLMYRLFASLQRTARLYPRLKACRNGLLRMPGIPPIDNLRR